MSKPFTNLETQVEILKSRGIIFDDEEDAKAKLYKYGYYNLINGYKSLFIARTLPSEIYMPGTKFDYFLIAHDIDFASRLPILQSPLFTGFLHLFVQNICANLCQFALFCRILCHILCHKSGHEKSPLRRAR